MLQATRTMSSQEITSLKLVVFDENGYFVDDADATLIDYTGDDEDKVAVEVESDDDTPDDDNEIQEQTYTVSLPQSASPRTIHFIANLPEGTKFEYGSERELINALETSGTADAYWQRTELRSILGDVVSEDGKVTASAGSELAKALNKIPLVRNFAKVSVDSEDVKSVFTNVQIAVFNAPQRGKIAPYNTNAGEWAAYSDDTDYADLTAAGYYGYVPTFDDDDFANVGIDANGVISGTTQYLYEYNMDGKKIEAGSKYPFVIIAGSYQGHAPSYYKVDLVDASGKYLNILRNFDYTVVIEKVSGDGYPDAAAAAAAAASNNINASIDTRNLLNISDGIGRLYVEYTTKYITDVTKPFTLKYKYVPSIQDFNETANDRVLVEGILDGTGSVIKSRVEGYTDLTGEMQGWREVTLNVQNPGAITHLQEIYLNVTDNANLHKTIRYRLQRPLQMEVNCWPEYIAKSAGKLMDVAIRIPDDLTPYLFPLDFAIEVQDHTLSPDASQQNNVMPVEPALSIVPDKAGKRSYHYVKTIETYEDYLALEMYGGLKLVRTYWLTTKEENASKVFVYNKYFNLNSDEFRNAESFTLLTFPDGVQEGIGKATAFQFNMNSITPVTVTLEGLSFSSTDPAATTMVYNPANTGRQTLPTLYTVNTSGNVKVTLNAEGYATEYLEAEQSNKVTIDKITITFTHSSSNRPNANSVVPELMVDGRVVTPGRVTCTRSGNNYTITCENVVFEGVTTQSVVTASYSHSSGNNWWQSHSCTFSGSATIGNLISHPTIAMTEQ